ncbi:uncharacterized protein LOC131250873 [Magnolia sinica]|uniref:uncharacterized protein LOC131250873 n=1 Tax=Magnolia sinica TaxID=86752 RepID=UPI0026584589|nr:uncharacterized protein LOC131250873 [Magnolia sinica]
MSPAMVDFRSPLQNPNPNSKGPTHHSSISRRPFNISQPNMSSSTDGSSRNFDAEGTSRNFSMSFTSPLPAVAPSVSGSSRPRLVKVRRHLGSQQSKPSTPATAGRNDPGFNPFRPAMAVSESLDRGVGGRMRDAEGRVGSGFDFFRSGAVVSDGLDGADLGFDLFRPRAPVSDGLDQGDDGKMRGMENMVDLGLDMYGTSESVSDGSERGDGTGMNVAASQVDLGFDLLRPKAPVSDGSDGMDDIRMQATHDWTEHLFKPSASVFGGSDQASDGKMGPTGRQADLGFNLSWQNATVSSGLDRADDRTRVLQDQLYGSNPFLSQENKSMDGSRGSKWESFEFGKSSDSGFKFAAKPFLNLDSGNVLPDEMRKLKIGSETASSNVDSSGFTFSAGRKGSSSSSSNSNLNFGEVPKKDNVFVFGSSGKKSSISGTNSADESKVSGLPDEIRKLKIDEKAKDATHNTKMDEKVSFFFGSNKSLAGSFDGSTETILPDEMKKLNIGSSAGVDDSKVSGLPDETGKLNTEEKAKDANHSFKIDEKGAFSFGSNKNVPGSFGGSTETLLPDEMKKLNIGSRIGVDTGGTDTGCSSSTTSVQDESNMPGLPDEMRKLKIEEKAKDANLSSKMDEKIGFVFGRSKNVTDSTSRTDMGHSSSSTAVKDGQFRNSGYGVFSDSALGSTSVPTPCTFQLGMQSNNLGTSQIPPIEPKGDPSLSSMGHASQSAGNIFDRPAADWSEKKPNLCFTSTREGLETPRADLRTPNQDAPCASMDNLFPGLGQNLEFSAKRGTLKNLRSNKKRGKLRPIQQRDGTHFISSEKSSQENSELGSLGSYSPMDFSPYQEEISSADQCSRETSVASDQSVPFATNRVSTDTNQSVPMDARDEDLLASTQHLNTNQSDPKCRELNSEGSKHFVEGSFGVNSLPSEKEKTINNDINIEMQADDGGNMFCFSSRSEDFGETNFTFAAPPPTLGPLSAAKRHYRKKNRGKVAPDSYSSTPNAKAGLASPAPQFFPPSSSLQHSHSEGQKGESAVSQNEAYKEQGVRQESLSTAAATAAAQEACEKWRLRGNQAYASGNLSKAEDYYTRGVNCVSPKETTRSCVRALMLCYSNRAATRMSVGRMRDALGDCMMAASIDPNFLKVQVRAANCYLALGEIEEALKHFKKCLQAGNDVSFDQKIRIEASDGLQKARQVAEYMDRSAVLLRQRKSNDAANALEILNEALSISNYSDNLFEMKAEALLMLRKYEEVVKLCEQTLDSSERNSTLIGDDGKLRPVDGSESLKNSSTRLWRWRLISKSYFYMGRLEEALDVLQKHEQVGPFAERFGSKMLESSVAFAVTVRELLRHKAAGNEAFLAGRHSEAVEHYTAAIACNVESRPFAAICFCNRAAAHQALGQITDAIADCSLAIALDSNYPKAISRRATLHEMIRDYGQAINDLHRLISLLEKQTEDKGNQSGTSGRSTSGANDLRQARIRLVTMEEEAKKEIPLDMYLILGIEPSCTASDIKKAYRKAALRHHPDKAGQFLARSENGDDCVWKEVADEIHKDADRLFKMIGEAYAVISDPTKRLRYDAEEEIRNAQKKGNGSGTPRSPGDVPSYPFEKSSNRRQWRDSWKPFGSPHQRWSEASRSNRYSS